MNTTAPTRPAAPLPERRLHPSDRLQALLEHLPAHEVITAQVNLDQILSVLDQLAPTGIPVRTCLEAALRHLAPAF